MDIHLFFEALVRKMATANRRTKPPTRPRKTTTRGDTGGLFRSTIRFSATYDDEEKKSI